MSERVREPFPAHDGVVAGLRSARWSIWMARASASCTGFWTVGRAATGGRIEQPRNPGRRAG